MSLNGESSLSKTVSILNEALSISEALFMSEATSKHSLNEEGFLSKPQ